MEKPASSNNPAVQHVAFHGFVTSATRIQRASRKISVVWNPSITCEADAETFIKKPPVRDRQQNLSKHILRLLVVDCDGLKPPKVDSNSGILKTAQEASWLDDHFLNIIKHGSSGSEVVQENENVSFTVQSPNDDGNPYFSFALSSSFALGYEREPDWTCLYFGSAQLNHTGLKRLLEETTYPDSYQDPISPDFMILPTTLLLWQVDQIADAVTQLRRELVEQDNKTAGEELKNADLKSFGIELSKIRKLHYQTQLRHAFAQGFTLNLARCFDIIEERHRVDSKTIVRYPPELRRILQSQKDILANIGRDLDNLPLRIEAEQSKIISTHSYLATDATRRDGTAMLTIAIITLLFLPGTFVAAVFSMPIFNWQANKQDNSERVVSKWVWLYFAIDIPLTLLIFGIWLWWRKRRDEQYSEELKHHIA